MSKQARDENGIRLDQPHWAAWLRANILPAPCARCGVVIRLLGWPGKSVIHHVDEDKTNNDPTNLQLMHRTCHLSHHKAGGTMSIEARQKISASKLGVPVHTAQSREAIAAGMRRVWAERKAV